jgi:hypothetical protein
MRFSWRLASLGFAFLVCACLPVTTKHPVGSTVGFKPDPAILGVWRGTINHDVAYIAFVSDNKGNTNAVLISPAHGSDGGDWDVYDAKAATLGGHHFLSVRARYSNGQESNDWPPGVTTTVLYRATARTLTLYLLDDAATATAIKTGAIHGTVDPDMVDAKGKITVRGDVHITEDGASLDAFMQSPRGLALFKTPLVALSRLD